MTISSSLNASVAGLAANSSRLSSISDNIANSSTYGYKRVETDFHSMVTGQSGGRYTAGGVRSSSQRMIGQSGSLVTTSNATDLAVRGRGFLPVAKAAEIEAGVANPQMYLTTTGSFRTDADGFLRTQSGQVLLGWPANADGTVPNFPPDSAVGLDPVQINLTQLVGEPTTAITLGMNLPATGTVAGAAGDPLVLPIEYFDNLGVTQTITATFTPTVPALGDPASNTWTMVLEDSVAPGVPIGAYDIVFDGTQATGGSILTVTPAAGNPGTAYDPATGSFVVNVDGGPVEVNIGLPGEGDGITQLGDSFAPLDIDKNGSPVGNVTAVEVTESGMVRAVYDTGAVSTVFQVPLVDVPNPNAMLAYDNQLYTPSPESGDFFLWSASDGPTGDLVSFAREESTTDVASELTAMIQTQRAYSSNAKVIQTVDEMLQETTNIKR